MRGSALRSMLVATVTLVAVACAGCATRPGPPDNAPTAGAAPATTAPGRTPTGARYLPGGRVGTADWSFRVPKGYGMCPLLSEGDPELTLGRLAERRNVDPDFFHTSIKVGLVPAAAQRLVLDQYPDVIVQEGRDVLGIRPVGKERPTRLAHAPAIVWEYEYTSDGRRIRSREVVVDHAGTRRTVTFRAEAGSFSALVSDFDAILGSWTWR